jgi:AcrR family transcriptional regulator
MTTSSRRRTKRPRRRTRLSTDQVRSRLYEGALARFRDQGYDATSVSELTRAAGVAKGTFFNHFPSKEHVLASWFFGVWEAEAGKVAAAGTRGAEAVVALFGAIMARLEEDPILAGALAARLADLPGLVDTGTGDTGTGEGAEGAPAPLDAVRDWSVERIRECLPVIVPIRPVADDDLAALLAGALAESLRESFLKGGRSLRPGHAATVANRTGLERRVGFLLASAGIPGN